LILQLQPRDETHGEFVAYTGGASPVETEGAAFPIWADNKSTGTFAKMRQSGFQFVAKFAINLSLRQSVDLPE
jgi:hypothetical protein